MQVNNNATDPSKAVDPSKETHKTQQAKIDPSKHTDASKHADKTAESERLAQSAKDFNKGLEKPNQGTPPAHDAAKIENAKEAVKADAFRRDREKMVKA